MTWPPKNGEVAEPIAQEHGLSPATVNNRMTGKVTGLGSQLGGTRRGKILSAG